jgi:hypothetical protein
MERKGERERRREEGKGRRKEVGERKSDIYFVKINNILKESVSCYRSHKFFKLTNLQV